MNPNQKFTIFCAKKCLHLWNAPEVVVEWLNNPQPETARISAASAASEAETTASSNSQCSSQCTIVDIAYKAAYAAAYAAATVDAICEADEGKLAVRNAIQSIKYAAEALNISIKELKQEFVSTWSEVELNTIDPDWIEYATAEIFEREKWHEP